MKCFSVSAEFALKSLEFGQMNIISGITEQSIGVWVRAGQPIIHFTAFYLLREKHVTIQFMRKTWHAISFALVRIKSIWSEPNDVDSNKHEKNLLVCHLIMTSRHFGSFKKTFMHIAQFAIIAISITGRMDFLKFHLCKIHNCSLTLFYYLLKMHWIHHLQFKWNGIDQIEEGWIAIWDFRWFISSPSWAWLASWRSHLNGILTRFHILSSKFPISKERIKKNLFENCMQKKVKWISWSNSQPFSYLHLNYNAKLII